MLERVPGRRGLAYAVRATALALVTILALGSFAFGRASSGPRASAQTAGSDAFIFGRVPANGGFGLVVFGGGSYDQLVAAAGCANSAVFWAVDASGRFVVFYPGTTVAAVNADFRALFPGNTVPPHTPLLGRCIPFTQGREVTLADDGGTIHVHVGETFLLKLGEDFTWTVELTDPSIVSRIPNVTVIRGAQGIYRAHQLGMTTLSASGTPNCAPNAACPQFVRLFRVDISVVE